MPRRDTGQYMHRPIRNLKSGMRRHMTTILNGWNATMSDRFGKDSILFNHRLRDTGLFTHDALARLIESYPAEHYNINTNGFAYSVSFTRANIRARNT